MLRVERSERSAPHSLLTSVSIHSMLFVAACKSSLRLGLKECFSVSEDCWGVLLWLLIVSFHNQLLKQRLGREEDRDRFGMGMLHVRHIAH